MTGEMCCLVWLLCSFWITRAFLDANLCLFEKPLGYCTASVMKILIGHSPQRHLLYIATRL